MEINVILIIILKLVAGFLLLTLAGDFLLKSSVAIATKFKMSKLLIGLTIVAFGTSAPELLVSLTAAIKGNSTISLGNVIGSNISNIGLVIGASALIFPIAIKPQTIKFDFPVMFLNYLLLLVFFVDGEISIFEGIAFIIALIFYIYFEFKLAQKYKKTELNNEVEDKEEISNSKFSKMWVAVPVLILSFVGLAYGADIFVQGAVDLAKILKVSEKVISLTIVAIGTSLPELFASVIASIKKENEIAVGNIIGSNIFNILCIIGITATVRPLKFDSHLYAVDMLWMFIFGILLFITFLPLKTKVIARIEGAVLLVIYIVYITLLFVQ